MIRDSDIAEFQRATEALFPPFAMDHRSLREIALSLIPVSNSVPVLLMERDGAPAGAEPKPPTSAGVPLIQGEG